MQAITKYLLIVHDYLREQKYVIILLDDYLYNWKRNDSVKKIYQMTSFWFKGYETYAKSD